MSLTAIIEVVFWPSTAVAILFVVLPWLKFPNQRRIANQWRPGRIVYGGFSIGFLAFMPPLLQIFLFDHSARLLFAQDFLKMQYRKSSEGMTS
jgi:hypothetical protein